MTKKHITFRVQKIYFRDMFDDECVSTNLEYFRESDTLEEAEKALEYSFEYEKGEFTILPIYTKD